MQDVTEHVQSLGYTGQTPVQVVDGYVVSPFRKFYPDFCHDLHSKRIKERIETGSLVKRNDVFDKERGRVKAVYSDEARVFWVRSGVTVVEWIPHLKLLDGPAAPEDDPNCPF